MVNVLEKNDEVLRNKFFNKWSEEKKLFQILFTHNDNPELIKKACELAKFLFMKGSLTEDNIDLIINSRMGKHETVLKEIYALVS